MGLYLNFSLFKRVLLQFGNRLLHSFHNIFILISACYYTESITDNPLRTSFSIKHEGIGCDSTPLCYLLLTQSLGRQPFC